ncbi:replication initiator protein [Microviridae sp.]|nr:replication initiator protein [Microviridae sp.]
MPVEVPCGSCIGCRLERSRQWAVRCHHEASLYDSNCFVTLTYSDQQLPCPPSIAVRPLQLFIKRLRKKYGAGIRFFACGEYGQSGSRQWNPHYHLILFNHDFPDKKLWKENKHGDHVYISESLQSLWQDQGFTTTAGVTFQSAAYVSRYIMKKVTGEPAKDHYSWVDPETGEVLQLTPEFVTMSRRPGIGSGWYDKWSGDVFPDDFIIVDGKNMRPPKYYDKLLEAEDAREHRKMKGKRTRGGKLHPEDQTPERRKVREKVKQAQIKHLGREL